MNKKKTLTILFSAILIFLIAISFVSFGLPIIHKMQERSAYMQDYSKHTRPLPDNVVKDLCEKFVESNDDLRCGHGVEVYAPQFFDVIKAKIFPRLDSKPSSDQIKQWLDIYQIGCEPPVRIHEIEQYYRCSYALGGDQIYPFSIYFNMDGSINDVIFSTGS